jgi:hypothetical protein
MTSKNPDGGHLIVLGILGLAAYAMATKRGVQSTLQSAVAGSTQQLPPSYYEQPSGGIQPGDRPGLPLWYDAPPQPWEDDEPRLTLPPVVYPNPGGGTIKEEVIQWNEGDALIEFDHGGGFLG